MLARNCCNRLFGAQVVTSNAFSTWMLPLVVFMSLFLYSTGYYQQPEVVQFTETPHDAVVCEGCRFELSCSILRQSSSAGEQYVPLPELEWIFNGTRINDLLDDAQVRVRDTATHRSAELSIFTARAHHNGVYQCRAKDGSNSTVCGESSSAISCVPTITISEPANIQIVGDTQYVETVSSCSDVVVLPCGRRLLGGVSVERPTLTWKRNGEELSLNSDVEILLANGDLAVNTASSATLGVYECIALFSNAGGRNVTVARHNITTRHHSREPETVVSLTSSADSAVLEGGRVELVCEASLIGGGGVCLSYNVTWMESPVVLSEGTPQSEGAPPTDDTLTSLLMNDHLLRITGLSNTTQYCCQVLTDDAILEECTIVHVVQQRAQPVSARTIFLKDTDTVTSINCSTQLSLSPLYQTFAWYRNGQLLENLTDSTLTLSSREDDLTDVFGVFQCFESVDDGDSVEEMSVTRLLPFGRTNPPSVPTTNEIPHPHPFPPYGNPFAATYEVHFDPPQFTGGLSRLYYNVSVRTLFGSFNSEQTADTNSVVVYLEEGFRVSIIVEVVSEPGDGGIASRQLSETISFFVLEIASHCHGRVLYPPSPSLNCARGLVNLSWTRVSENDVLFTGSEQSRLELEYAIGNCTHPDGSVDRYQEEVPTSPHAFYEDALKVGTRCQFSMASTKEPPNNCPNGETCFCYDLQLVMHSNTVECYVQGFVQFVSNVLEVFENDSLVEVCVRSEGYGFAVNISTDGLNLTSPFNQQLYFDRYNGSMDNIQCVNISLLDNNIVEKNTVKNFTVFLSTDSTLVTVGEPAIVQVKDNDYVLVLFTQSFYSVREGEGPLQVCVMIDKELETDIPITIHSEDDTAQAGVDYSPVNVTLVFTPTNSPVKCFSISIIDDLVSERDKALTLSMSTTSDRAIVGTFARVVIKDSDVNQTQSSKSDYSTITISVLLSLSFFIIVLMVGTSVCCLVRKKRLRRYTVSHQKDIGSIDWSVEPAVLINADNSYYLPMQFSETDFDCTTLLDYLGPPTAGTTDIDTKLPLQILSTEQDNLLNSDSPQDENGKRESYHVKQDTNCYNISVESGVVLDSDLDPVTNARQLGEGSSNLSQSLSHVHSYIGMGNDDLCTCSECRLQRERSYSTKTGGCETLEHIRGGDNRTSQLSRLNDFLIGDLMSPLDKDHDDLTYCPMSERGDSDQMSSTHCDETCTNNNNGESKQIHSSGTDHEHVASQSAQATNKNA